MRIIKLTYVPVLLNVPVDPFKLGLLPFFAAFNNALPLTVPVKSVNSSDKSNNEETNSIELLFINSIKSALKVSLFFSKKPSIV